jgi:dihydroxyacetone kinase-like protein
MQKILNDPEPFVDEMLDGILAAHADQLRRPSPRAIVRADAPVDGKVGIATGGGSGHLPVFMGYVGRGLLDGAAIGNVFASPSSDDMLEVTRAVSAGRGVLYLYGNYGGDRLNFDLAAELAADDGIEVRTILGADDIASASPERHEARRGIAGIFFLYKVAGAKAAEGASLADVVAVTERAAAGLRTMGVALSPCTIPAAGVPTFELPAGQMEIGMGIHGEPGVRRGPLATADEIAEELTRLILGDLPYRHGDEVAVLVNGLGATPKEELYILYRGVASILAAEGIRVHRVWVGEYATSLEMAGASISLLRLDDELRRLVDAPAETPFFVQA